MSKRHPDDVKEVVVWKRFSELRKLHGEMAYTHKNLFRRQEEFPPFPHAQVFGIMDIDCNVLCQLYWNLRSLLSCFVCCCGWINNSIQLEFASRLSSQSFLERNYFFQIACIKHFAMTSYDISCLPITLFFSDYRITAAKAASAIDSPHL